MKRGLKAVVIALVLFSKSSPMESATVKTFLAKTLDTAETHVSRQCL